MEKPRCTSLNWKGLPGRKDVHIGDKLHRKTKQ